MEDLGPKLKSSNLKDKQTLWNQTMDQLNQIADRLGKPIDAGIRETVVAFIVNNFPTDGSCEGHVEERFGKIVKLCPYISVGIGEPKQRFIGEPEIKERIAIQQGVTVEELEHNEIGQRAYWNYIREQDIQETSEFLEIRKKNQELERAVSEILNTFYKSRQVNLETKLIIERVGPTGHFRVTSARENPEEIQEDELGQYKEQLLAEQQELQAFTAFLKERFFSQ